LGTDHIRHLVVRTNTKGETRYFWQPSKTIRSLGMTPEALGADLTKANSRATELNSTADELRRASKTGSNGPLPGSVASLFKAYEQSDEFNELKERTQNDYRYYLGKIEADFGRVMVRALTPKVIKEHYRRVNQQVSLTWAYHILGQWRAVLSWAVSENWITRNPALDVKMKSPPKRKVVWSAENARAYIAKADELGWHSIVAMAYVFDSIGQSPVDVRTMARKAYDGRAIDVTLTKTGVEDAPIPLFREAKTALDFYLASQPAKLPDAPMFTHDRIGGAWKESTLAKIHGQIRKAAGLPKHLQLQDFRTTVQTEGGAAGGTVDELRGLARHKTRTAALHYVHPDARYVEAIQKKRRAYRNKKGGKVGMVPENKLESTG
jgi:site-specific recombinase XerC